MIIYAFLVAIFQCGSTHAASEIGMSKSEFSAIVTGMFFLVIIASQFFVNYKIVLYKKEETQKDVPIQTVEKEPIEEEKSEEGK